MRERYGPEPSAAVRERLAHELDVICRMGFAGYFLIVHDFVRFAAENRIPASARGSACGAMVSYVLKLSHVDPPPTLLWWLCSLRVTLESLACTLATSPPDALATSLQAYLAQHPEQAAELRQVFVEALERDFARWDRVRALIAAAAE